MWRLKSLTSLDSPSTKVLLMKWSTFLIKLTEVLWGLKHVLDERERALHLFSLQTALNTFQFFNVQSTSINR